MGFQYAFSPPFSHSNVRSKCGLSNENDKMVPEKSCNHVRAFAFGLPSQMNTHTDSIRRRQGAEWRPGVPSPKKKMKSILGARQIEREREKEKERAAAGMDNLARRRFFL